MRNGAFLEWQCRYLLQVVRYSLNQKPEIKIGLGGTCHASVRVVGTRHAWVVGTCHASGVGICHGTLVTLEWWALVTLEWWALLYQMADPKHKPEPSIMSICYGGHERQKRIFGS